MKKILFLLFLVSGLTLFSCAPKTTTVSETPQVKNATYYYKLGISYLQAGNNAQAIYYLRKAYEISPDDPDILNALGVAYSNVGEFQKAEEILKKAIKIAPNKAETYTNLGAILAKEKKYKEAIKYFHKAIENPNYMKKDLAYYNIAMIYKEIGDKKKEEENLKKAIAYNAYILPAYIALGNLYIQEKRYKDALNVFLSAIDKGASDARIYLGLGKSYYYLNHPEKARIYLIKAKKLAENNELLKLEIEKYLNLIDKKTVKRRNIFNINQEDNVAPSPQAQQNTENANPYTGGQTIAKYTPETQEKPQIVKPKIRFYVLVGRYSNKKAAISIAEKLKAKGYNPEIKRDIIDGKAIYSVIIGYFKEYREASRFYRKNLRPLGIRGIVKFTRK